MAIAAASKSQAGSLCDLRDWLKEVKRLEQLEQIAGADWNLEIGALTEIILERIATPPAVIFERVPGFDPGRRVLVNMLETLERTALTLGLPLDLKTIPLIDALRARGVEEALDELRPGLPGIAVDHQGHAGDFGVVGRRRSETRRAGARS